MTWNDVYAAIEKALGGKHFEVVPYNCTYDYMGGYTPYTVTEYRIEDENGKVIGEATEEIPYEGETSVYWELYR